MMVEIAKATDQKEIYEIWKEMFADDDGGYTDFFFQNVFHPQDCMIIRKDGMIAATLIRRRHDIMWNGVTRHSSMILGVATRIQYRRLGLMSSLMEACLKIVKQEDDMTMIQAYDPSLYTPFGFEMRYLRKHVQIKRPIQIDALMGEFHKLRDYEIDQLTACYEQYAKRYDGWYVRDNAYYKLLDLEMKAQQGDIYTYVIKDRILGYACIYPKGDYWSVPEFIYIDEEAGKAMLSKMLEYVNELIIDVPVDETLFGYGINKEDTFDFTMLLFHDSTLDHNEKPLFMHEYA